MLVQRRIAILFRFVSSIWPSLLMSYCERIDSSALLIIKPCSASWHQFPACAVNYCLQASRLTWELPAVVLMEMGGS